MVIDEYKNLARYFASRFRILVQFLFHEHGDLLHTVLHHSLAFTTLLCISTKVSKLVQKGRIKFDISFVMKSGISGLS